jgi:hypothetical protein
MEAARHSSIVGTRSGRAKRARAEDADPPDALSGTPTVHTNNWYIYIWFPVNLEKHFSHLIPSPTYEDSLWLVGETGPI